MSDELMNPEVPQSPAPPVGEVVEVKPASRKGLFIVLGVLAVLVVVAAIAVTVVLFVFNGVKSDIGVGVTPIKQNGTGSTQAPTDAPVAAGPADAVANDEVFTFRDIFKPLAGAAASTTTSGTGSETSTVDTSEYAADTLYLVAISTSGNAPVAQMVWNQKEYSLSEGDVIAGTPWKVLDIRTDDVIMLYGDQQVVLSIGQGISK
ncbi:MAG: hypothetical protein Q8S43_05615 [Actinomycetota bacterium]|nr:MAG: hypothetical protein FD171_793 [Actinomycetota bacterium]MDO8949332.1 hypothetical protein [Actinomycetota bacterium]MDP3630417.1 hypothetical protein [Actinomycetota bacterium]